MIKRLLYSDVDATTFTGGNYRSDFRLRMSLWNKVGPRIQVYSTTTRKDLFPKSLLAIPTDLNHFWDCKDVHCFVCGYIRKITFGNQKISTMPTLNQNSSVTLQSTRYYRCLVYWHSKKHGSKIERFLVYFMAPFPVNLHRSWFVFSVMTPYCKLWITHHVLSWAQ